MSWYYLEELLAEEDARLERELKPYKELIAQGLEYPPPPECAKGDWANCLKCQKLGKAACPHERSYLNGKE